MSQSVPATKKTIAAARPSRLIRPVGSGRAFQAVSGAAPPVPRSNAESQDEQAQPHEHGRERAIGHLVQIAPGRGRLDELVEDGGERDEHGAGDDEDEEAAGVDRVDEGHRRAVARGDLGRPAEAGQDLARGFLAVAAGGVDLLGQEAAQLQRHVAALFSG